VIASFHLFGLAGLSLVGVGFLVFFGVGLLFIIYDILIIKLIIGIVFEIWMLFGLLISALNGFQYYHLIFATGLYEGVFAIFLFRDAAKKWKRGKNREKISFKDKRTKISAISLSAVFIIGLIFSFSPFYSNKTHTFEVSDTQAQNYELVLYLPATMEAVNACRDANATLSFNMDQSLFNVSNPTGTDLANIVDYANQEGVPIEIWPLFDSDGNHYISSRKTIHLWGLYADFHNWTVFHNITVDYILWDIEDWIQIEDLNYMGWARNVPLLNVLGNISMYGVIFKDNLRNWPSIIEEWKSIAIQAQSDGHIIRGTVNPRAWDYADSDFDLSVAYFMPSYELLPEFQYVSSMIYTGCEWGMAAGGAQSEYVYQSLTQIKRVNPGPLAVCLGCLNYVQYQNIPAVKNDVMLALAEGADAIRLFQGGSWVNGWIGPAHGYQGLYDLLAACRTGGQGSYTHTGAFDLMFVGATVADIIIDFYKW